MQFEPRVYGKQDAQCQGMNDYPICYHNVYYNIHIFSLYQCSTHLEIITIISVLLFFRGIYFTN